MQLVRLQYSFEQVTQAVYKQIKSTAHKSSSFDCVYDSTAFQRLGLLNFNQMFVHFYKRRLSI